jgi:hypothetical protein
MDYLISMPLHSNNKNRKREFKKVRLSKVPSGCFKIALKRSIDG